MNLLLISNIIACVSAFFGCIYGVIMFFRPKKALYAQMIVLGVGCIAFGRLFQVTRLLTNETITNEFQLGILGVIGSFIFFFSANFGLMDSLVDDGSKELRRYRLIPIAAPAAAVVLYFTLFLFGNVDTLWKILGGVLTVLIFQSSYFNLKHFIFPDVEFGIAKSLKSYNLLTLIYSLLSICEFYAMGVKSEPAVLVICIFTGIVTAAIIPMLSKGVNKWTV